MPSATSLEDEVVPLISGLDMDPQSLFIYFVIASVGGLGIRYVYRKFFPAQHSGYGWGSPGFITSGVRKAWVPNPNPGRQIIERDDRHLYQSGVAAPEPEAATPHASFSIKEKLAAEKAALEAGGKKVKENTGAWEDEWLPAGTTNAPKQRKSKSKK